jgi:hypothetical protein
MQWIFAFGGMIGGYWVGWRLGEAFQRRFESPDASIPGWHIWVVGTLWFGSMIIGAFVGLAIHDLL